MKKLINRVQGVELLDMKKVIEEVTNLDVEYAVIGDSLYINSSATLESAPESAQHVLKFNTEVENNGAGWDFIFGCNSFQEIIEKTAKDNNMDYEYFNPEIIYLVESAAQPSAFPCWVKDGYYTYEEYNKLMEDIESEKELGYTPAVYQIVGTVGSREEAEDWLAEQN